MYDHRLKFEVVDVLILRSHMAVYNFTPKTCCSGSLETANDTYQVERRAIEALFTDDNISGIIQLPFQENFSIETLMVRSQHYRMQAP